MATTPPPGDQDPDASTDDWDFGGDADGLLDSLAAATEAEMEMHLTARVALLNLLQVDPAVDELHWRWMHSTAFGRAVYEFVEHLGRTAEAVGLPNAWELLMLLKGASEDGTITVQAADEADAERIARVFDGAVVEANRLLDDLIAASTNLDLTPLADDAIALVRDTWRLPWPWVADDLLRSWALRMVQIAFGTQIIVDYWVESDGSARPAPAIDFRFETGEGETVADAFLRFGRQMLDAVLGPLEAAAAPLPRGRVTDARVAQRFVEWWYRRKVLEESIRSIADKDDGKRAHVRYGIAQAERWLSVSNCVWKDDDAA